MSIQKRHPNKTRDEGAGISNRPEPGYTYQGSDFSPLPPDERCGTYAGWNAHRLEGSPPCRPCQDAQAQYMREWRYRTGRVKSRRVRLTDAELALLGRGGGMR